MFTTVKRTELYPLPSLTVERSFAASFIESMQQENLRRNCNGTASFRDSKCTLTNGCCNEYETPNLPKDKHDTEVDAHHVIEINSVPTKSCCSDDTPSSHKFPSRKLENSFPDRSCDDLALLSSKENNEFSCSTKTSSVRNILNLGDADKSQDAFTPSCEYIIKLWKLDDWLLVGETPVFIGTAVGNSRLILTNYRLIYCPCDDITYDGSVVHRNIFFNIPIGVVDKSSIKDVSILQIDCKDGRIYKITFPSVDTAEEWRKKIDRITDVPSKFDEVFAFTHFAWYAESTLVPRPKVSPVKSWLEFEVARLGFDLRTAWRISNVNKDFKLCASYPENILVPHCITDAHLEKVATFRSAKRIPSVVYRYRRTGSVLARSSQPEVGLLGWRSAADEQLIQAITDACSFDGGDDERRGWMWRRGRLGSAKMNKDRTNDDNQQDSKESGVNGDLISRQLNDATSSNDESHSDVPSSSPCDNTEGVTVNNSCTTSLNNNNNRTRWQSEGGEHLIVRSDSPLDIQNLSISPSDRSSSHSPSNQQRNASTDQIDKLGASPEDSCDGRYSKASLKDLSSEQVRSRRLLIIDARSYAAAVTNRARGGGVECEVYYPNAEILFMYLANIHAIRKSFNALKQLLNSSIPCSGGEYHNSRVVGDGSCGTIVSNTCTLTANPISSSSTIPSSLVSRSSFNSNSSTILTNINNRQQNICDKQNQPVKSSNGGVHGPSNLSVNQSSNNSLSSVDFYVNLDATRWLFNISNLLTSGVRVARAMVMEGRPVLVHCSDGWDRTPQICSLAQILVDPFYRTMKGFEILIEREWLDHGHKMRDRNGACDDENERSPIFLQWLDTIHQLLHQFPFAFEFNISYLVKLSHHIYSSLFGTFLSNSPSERSTYKVNERTKSVFSYLNDEEKNGWKYRNHLYSHHLNNSEYDCESFIINDDDTLCCDNNNCKNSNFIHHVLWPKVDVRDLFLWREVYTSTPVESRRVEYLSDNWCLSCYSNDRMFSSSSKSFHQNRNKHTQCPFKSHNFTNNTQSKEGDGEEEERRAHRNCLFNESDGLLECISQHQLRMDRIVECNKRRVEFLSLELEKAREEMDRLREENKQLKKSSSSTVRLNGSANPFNSKMHESDCHNLNILHELEEALREDGISLASSTSTQTFSGNGGVDLSIQCDSSHVDGDGQRQDSASSTSTANSLFKLIKKTLRRHSSSVVLVNNAEKRKSDGFSSPNRKEIVYDGRECLPSSVSKSNKRRSLTRWMSGGSTTTTITSTEKSAASVKDGLIADCETSRQVIDSTSCDEGKGERKRRSVDSNDIQKRLDNNSETSFVSDAQEATEDNCI